MVGGPGFWVWVNNVELRYEPHPRLINRVDCLLTHGMVTVIQNGTSPPTLDRSTFDLFHPKSAEFKSVNGSKYPGYAAVTDLRQIYTERHLSPYDFNLSGYFGPNTLYQNPVAYYLLGEDSKNGAESVARQIEANFDMATLQAFSRGPNSSSLVFTYAETIPVYAYNPMVLLVLVVPLVATILGTWGRWRVGSIEDGVIGYDPIAIARLGPVGGLVSGLRPTDRMARAAEDQREVWGCWQLFMAPEGTVLRGAGLQTSEPSAPEQLLLKEGQGYQ
ncbi:hypothetical protein B0T21DRAFT_369979 [Apiosordaria backusii]|uniref:Uncharacterized protein n=1 Tax=Apiosordaria backusii TaxID=314023 RepID=A0AA40B789_9PEZI|nr:hypothetical protein B0T21DRAFT_369979 [Apiosordaria backusii]